MASDSYSCHVGENSAPTLLNDEGRRETLLEALKRREIDVLRQISLLSRTKTDPRRNVQRYALKRYLKLLSRPSAEWSENEEAISSLLEDYQRDVVMTRCLFKGLRRLGSRWKFFRESELEKAQERFGLNDFLSLLPLGTGQFANRVCNAERAQMMSLRDWQNLCRWLPSVASAWLRDYALLGVNARGIKSVQPILSESDPVAAIDLLVVTRQGDFYHIKDTAVHRNPEYYVMAVRRNGFRAEFDNMLWYRSFYNRVSTQFLEQEVANEGDLSHLIRVLNYSRKPDQKRMACDRLVSAIQSGAMDEDSLQWVNRERLNRFPYTFTQVVHSKITPDYNSENCLFLTESELIEAMDDIEALLKDQANYSDYKIISVNYNIRYYPRLKQRYIEFVRLLRASMISGEDCYRNSFVGIPQSFFTDDEWSELLYLDLERNNEQSFTFPRGRDSRFFIHKPEVLLGVFKKCLAEGRSTHREYLIRRLGASSFGLPLTSRELIPDWLDFIRELNFGVGSSEPENDGENIVTEVKSGETTEGNENAILRGRSIARLETTADGPEGPESADGHATSEGEESRIGEDKDVNTADFDRACDDNDSEDCQGIYLVPTFLGREAMAARDIFLRIARQSSLKSVVRDLLVQIPRGQLKAEILSELQKSKNLYLAYSSRDVIENYPDVFLGIVKDASVETLGFWWIGSDDSDSRKRMEPKFWEHVGYIMKRWSHDKKDTLLRILQDKSQEAHEDEEWGMGMRRMVSLIKRLFLSKPQRKPKMIRVVEKTSSRLSLRAESLDAVLDELNVVKTVWDLQSPLKLMRRYPFAHRISKRLVDLTVSVFLSSDPAVLAGLTSVEIEYLNALVKHDTDDFMLNLDARERILEHVLRIVRLCPGRKKAKWWIKLGYGVTQNKGEWVIMMMKYDVFEYPTQEEVFHRMDMYVNLPRIGDDLAERVLLEGYRKDVALKTRLDSMPDVLTYLMYSCGKAMQWRGESQEFGKFLHDQKGGEDYHSLAHALALRFREPASYSLFLGVRCGLDKAEDADELISDYSFRDGTLSHIRPRFKPFGRSATSHGRLVAVEFFFRHITDY